MKKSLDFPRNCKLNGHLYFSYPSKKRNQWGRYNIILKCRYCPYKTLDKSEYANRYKKQKMNIDISITISLEATAKEKTILDLGGYDGKDCNTALLAGAKSAVCVDDESWKTYDNWKEFNPYPQVTYVKDDFMNYNIPADIVIFKNVIYHQRNPWKTMEHVRKVTKLGLLLATSYIEGDEPMWKIYKPFEGHPVSWTVAWRPTKLGLIKLLEATGFENVTILTEKDNGSLALAATPGKLPIGFGERN